MTFTQKLQQGAQANYGGRYIVNINEDMERGGYVMSFHIDGMPAHKTVHAADETAVKTELKECGLTARDVRVAQYE